MKSIDKVGRKMPYRVPDGYFDVLTEKIIDDCLNRDHAVRHSVFHVCGRVAAAVVAVFAVLLTVHLSFDRDIVSVDEVGQAYMALSDYDKAVLSDLYLDDYYLFDE